jgi:hypothetical protein
MRSDFARHHHLSPQVHPLVYAGIVGLALWFALAAWGFAGDGYTDYLLVVVSGFVAVAVALPLILSRIGRADQPLDTRPHRGSSFRAWAAGDLDAAGPAQGQQRGNRILLPLAAVAFGMTLFAIVLHFAARGAGPVV